VGDFPASMPENDLEVCFANFITRLFRHPWRNGRQRFDVEAQRVALDLIMARLLSCFFLPSIIEKKQEEGGTISHNNLCAFRVHRASA
jgi:hypothetical protein